MRGYQEPIDQILGGAGKVDPERVISDDDNHHGIEVYVAVGGIVIRPVTTGEPPDRWVASGPRICLDPDELGPAVVDAIEQYREDLG